MNILIGENKTIIEGGINPDNGYGIVKLTKLAKEHDMNSVCDIPIYIEFKDSEAAKTLKEVIEYIEGMMNE